MSALKIVVLVAFYVAFTALSLFAFALFGWAQEPVPSQAPPAGEKPATVPRPIQAARLDGIRPRLDGRLDEPAWADVPFVSGFYQKEPNEGLPATDLTEIGFLFDGDALYVGARMHSPGPGSIRASLSRRDDPGNSERIIVSLDTYHDRRTAWTFAVTACGVRVDYYHPTDNEGDRDYSFDPVWEAKVARGDSGWTAEMRIPYSQLRFSREREQTWGVNINRWVPTRVEDDYWVVVPKDGTGWSSRMATLSGIEGIEPPRRLELLPYAASNASFRSQVDGDDPFADEQDYASRFGGDLKMGLGPNVTIEGTVNPDFGQVEADPAEVNLSAFETFFDERRPFFIEGSQLLRGRGPSYFYSRRIGAEPRGSAEGDYEERPSTTSILGAAKATGRFESGASLGVLGAITSREKANTFDASTQTYGEDVVAPVAGWGAGRYEQQFGKDASTAGVTFAAVGRDVEPGEPLSEEISRTALSGGADWNLRFKGGTYLLSGYAGGSSVSGDSGSIERLQRSSARYYQRPDADYLTFDPSRTALAGYTVSSTLEKAGGRHWLWNAGGGLESPGFELNDAGRLSTSDDVDTWGGLTYRETVPGKRLHAWNVGLSPQAGWNYGGVRTYSGLGIGTDLTFKNYMTASADLSVFTVAYSDVFSRGGPLMKDPATRNWSFAFRSSYASNTQWSVNQSYSEDDADGYGFHSSASISVRPSDRWRLTLSPSYNRSLFSFQYVQLIEGGGREETYGDRYVMAPLDRSTLSAQGRVNYTLTPDLSLEAYLEPFASSGRYTDYGELLRPQTYRLLTYGKEGNTTAELQEDGSLAVTDGSESFTIDNNDFNVLSFRSNVVLRWEWRLGSTLFFVWQQNREGFEPTGEMVGFSDVGDSFSAEGENFLALKVSYWLPVR